MRRAAWAWARREVLRRIEMPLALPVIVAGMRIATVTIISVAVVAAYINAGGLGTIIFNGISNDHAPKIWTGAHHRVRARGGRRSCARAARDLASATRGMSASAAVIPAKAGIQCRFVAKTLVPASRGTTTEVMVGAATSPGTLPNDPARRGLGVHPGKPGAVPERAWNARDALGRRARSSRSPSPFRSACGFPAAGAAR